MSQDKTEKATPKKRQDARKKGQVMKSQEINIAVSLLAVFFVIKLFSGFYVQKGMEVCDLFFTMDAGVLLDAQEASRLLWQASGTLFLMVAPALATALLAGVITNVLQVGFMYSPEAIQPKLDKLNPINGFKRMFSMNALFEMAKSILKVTVVGFLVYQEFTKEMNTIPSLLSYSVAAGTQRFMDMLTNIVLRAGIGLIILAAFDFLYQFFKYEKDLKMTKQEVKDEYKQQEGDPALKGKIKQKQREMGMMRMMSAVPEADVIITNPTHYAIALRYDESRDTAPLVLAKGKDYVARKIREKAMEAGIEIVQNKPVAQALYFYCEVGEQIPTDLYQAVAEVLAYVYNIKHPAKQGGGTR